MNAAILEKPAKTAINGVDVRHQRKEKIGSIQTSNGKPIVRAAFGWGLHDHLDRFPVGRFSLRWNHDSFADASTPDVRDLVAAPETCLAA